MCKDKMLGKHFAEKLGRPISVSKVKKKLRLEVFQVKVLTFFPFPFTLTIPAHIDGMLERLWRGKEPRVLHYEKPKGLRIQR